MPYNTYCCHQETQKYYIACRFAYAGRICFVYDNTEHHMK